MSTVPSRPVETEDVLPRPRLGETEISRGVIAWSSLLFVLLQSVCTFFTALDGLRVVVGRALWLVLFQPGRCGQEFHADWFRVPMVGLALGGAVLNLVMLRRVRRLRSRPAARWRQRPLAPGVLRRERFVLAMLTLGLIFVEEVTHWRTFHRF